MGNLLSGPLGGLIDLSPFSAGGELSPPLTDIVWWFEADVGVTDAGSGKVSAWADQSGNGYDLSQGTAGNRPTIVTGVVNGQPVIRFERSNSEFLVRASTPVLTQPFTLTFVVAAVAGSADACLFDEAGTDFRFVQLEEDGASNWAINIFAGNDPLITPTKVTGGTFVWIEAVFNGASSEIRVTNVQRATGNPGSSGTDGIRLGLRHDGNLPLDGDIALSMAHAKVFDAGERSEMAAYIARYGIS
jgi:hypothetical protein